MNIITINNTNYEFQPGQTILDVCKKNNIFIPSLCHVEGLEAYGSCFVCVVEVLNGKAGIYPSCATFCQDNMILETENSRVKEIRKMALELLMSDHFGDCIAPCTLEGCPANINIQGFLALEKEGRYLEAASLIRQKAPIPNILGRICPAPCEKVCRRNRVDEPVSIRIQKRYISDREIAKGGPFLPAKNKATKKQISIIGSGPTGITAAYFLALEGHSVTIYEAHPKHGGMTRYGIPYYRLPEEIIDQELNAIIDQLGIKIFYNTKIGKDLSFDYLLNNFDAILIAIGAQLSTNMNIPGENSNLVIPAVNYLEQTAKHQTCTLGKTTLVIGGGHTAMDAARTAIRKGTKTTIIYRRSQDEMPGKDEIEEAIEEGVNFEFLAAPTKIVETNKQLKVTCIRMGLNEADASGRRKPYPLEGSEFDLTIDSLIMAIGQKVDSSFLPPEFINKWGTLDIEQRTFQTKNNKVFAAGDCVNGPDLVVTAVEAGRKSAIIINQFLNQLPLTGEKKLFSSVTGKLEELPDSMFEEYTKSPKMNIPHISLDERKTSFKSIELSSTEKDIQAEASRCLSCGCIEINDCKLKEYCEIYEVDTQMYAGENRTYSKDKSHSDVILEEDKCINCASCIRTAESNGNFQMLGLTNRGFSSRVKPPFNEEMKKINPKAYQEVVKNCPTAGIRIANKKIDHFKSLI